MQWKYRGLYTHTHIHTHRHTCCSSQNTQSSLLSLQSAVTSSSEQMEGDEVIRYVAEGVLGVPLKVKAWTTGPPLLCQSHQDSSIRNSLGETVLGSNTRPRPSQARLRTMLFWGGGGGGGGGLHIPRPGGGIFPFKPCLYKMAPLTQTTKHKKTTNPL